MIKSFQQSEFERGGELALGQGKKKQDMSVDKTTILQITGMNNFVRDHLTIITMPIIKIRVI